jgi:imidazolonepropionase
VGELVSMGKHRLSEAQALGTTTIEVKSGYGLSVNSEMRLLEACGRISEQTRMDIHTTWLGAHDFPKGKKQSEYMDELISEQLPLVAEQGVASWVDVFCEPGWFDIDQTERIVVAAKELGLTPRLHVDEFVDSGGLALASELGSVSADHVAHSNDDSRELASKAGTMQTFLPGTPYVMGSNDYPPIGKCLDNEWAFSLATDFNPNCNSLSIPFSGSLAAHRCGIDPISALTAVTRNPSTTLGYGADIPVGSISVGMDADLNILKGHEVEKWCQTPGMNPISSTIIKGIL